MSDHRHLHKVLTIQGDPANDAVTLVAIADEMSEAWCRGCQLTRGEQ